MIDDLSATEIFSMSYNEKTITAFKLLFTYLHDHVNVNSRLKSLCQGKPCGCTQDSGGMTEDLVMLFRFDLDEMRSAMVITGLHNNNVNMRRSAGNMNRSAPRFASADLSQQRDLRVPSKSASQHRFGPRPCGNFRYSCKI